MTLDMVDASALGPQVLGLREAFRLEKGRLKQSFAEDRVEDELDPVSNK